MIVADTTGPFITSIGFDRFNATLTVTFQDNLSGTDMASLSNLAFYHISGSRLSASARTQVVVAETRFFDTAWPAHESITVHVVFKHKHILPGGKYEVLINSGTGDTGIHEWPETPWTATCTERSAPATVCRAATTSRRSRRSIELFLCGIDKNTGQYRLDESVLSRPGSASGTPNATSRARRVIGAFVCRQRP